MKSELETRQPRNSLFNKFLDIVEIAGNKLPDPVTFFTLLCGLILILSWIAESVGLQAVNPGTNETIKALSLLNKDGLIRMLTNMVSNFSSFPPLGLVLVTMVGVGIADKAGLITAIMRSAVARTPASLLVPIIIFIAVISNGAGDCGPIVLPPLAAVIFLSLKRHPLAGMVLAYGACLGGFSANILITMTDALAAGFTQQAAQLIDPNYATNPANNWFFLIAATFIFIPVSTYINNKVVEPRLGEYTGEAVSNEPISETEQRGLRAAGIATLIFVAILALLTLPPNAILRHPETGGLAVSPFIDSIIPITMLLFLIPGLAYGFSSGSIKTTKDISAMISKSMAELGSFLALAFVASQFLAYFTWSNLGPIIAIKGADFLKNAGLTGLSMLIGFIIISTIINIFIPSASAKWGILSSVFVPMLMLLGYNPAFTQLAYRIGDSITNPITPLMPYFAIMLGYAQQYEKNIGMGTLISLLLPYSLVMGLFWIILFAIWFLLGLPVGPGAPIFL